MNYVNCTGAMPQELDIYTTLKENQLAHYYEPAPGLFIAESPQVIRMALEAGYEPESFLLEKGTEEKFFEELGCRKDYNYVNQKHGNYVNLKNNNITVYITPHEQLARLTGYELTGGALAAFRRKPLPQPEEILAGVSRAVALECVMNPRNIGSIFRSAAAIGFDAVLLTKGSCDPLYRRAARVSMGTVFQIPWTFADDVSVLKKNGFVTVAMALTDESVPMDDDVLKGHEKLAVLMGSERTGLKEKTIREADHTAKIPMKHGVDSLNVAAASAVAFWELRK